LADDVPGLTVSRIDPVAETQAYTDNVLATSGKDLDDAGRELLREDLRSPCTEEVAVFHAFWKLVREARGGSSSSTPPRPAIRCCCSMPPEAITAKCCGISVRKGKSVTTPLMMLQDPEYTRVLIVQRCPRRRRCIEAARLQVDLRRADIEPYGWVVNSSLAAASTTDPILVRRAQAERPQIERIQTELAQRTFIVPQLAEPPVGRQSLHQLFTDERRAPMPTAAR
jgi:arsenite/tail-anchored protein-transporting ATPase